ncbi:MAG: DUF2442 domain-containing protein [Pirellulales bacterium]|nr:DUF2442 domain-containing protein [Pirellulales bacterium]
MTEVRIQNLGFTEHAITVVFDNNQSIEIPLGYFPRLCHGTVEEQNQWQLIGDGLGVHWESLDEDLSIENFLLAYSKSKSPLLANHNQAPTPTKLP